MQMVVNGLAAGSAYALVALALVLVLKGTGVANFAQAHIGLLGAFVAWMVIDKWSITYPVAVVIGLAASVLLALIVERVLIRPILSSSHLTAVIMTVGVMVGIESVIGIVWTTDPRALDSPIGGSFSLAGARMTYPQLVALLAAIVITILLSRFFASPLGVQVRAIAEDRVTPRLLGVRVSRVFALSWAIAAAISAFGVILFAQGTILSASIGAGLIIKAFVAATIGGFSSITGALVGGLALGVLENLAGTLISTSAAPAVSLVLIIAILAIRPTGLFQQAKVREI
jgi:branched-chain amino acid transport system permease protein